MQELSIYFLCQFYWKQSIFDEDRGTPFKGVTNEHVPLHCIVALIEGYKTSEPAKTQEDEKVVIDDVVAMVEGPERVHVVGIRYIQ